MDDIIGQKTPNHHDPYNVLYDNLIDVKVKCFWDTAVTVVKSGFIILPHISCIDEKCSRLECSYHSTGLVCKIKSIKHCVTSVAEKSKTDCVYLSEGSKDGDFQMENFL